MYNFPGTQKLQVVEKLQISFTKLNNEKLLRHTKVFYSDENRRKTVSSRKVPHEESTCLVNVINKSNRLMSRMFC